MHSNFYDFVYLQCINSFQLIKTKFRVPATQSAWCLRVTELKTNYTPYSKMAKILEFFCFHANWPLWPRSRLNILLNFTFESEAIRANLHGNKRVLKWRPSWNKVSKKKVEIL